MRIDLHTHSCFSDGTDTPTQLMLKAGQAGLDMVGLTDHDTVDGWKEAEKAVNSSGVALIRGTEISCKAYVDGSAMGRSVHMLSYLHQGDDQGLKRLFEDVKNARTERVKKMVELLARDYRISLENVYSHAQEGVAIGRPHIADALVSAGYFTDRSECFNKVLYNGSPYYVIYCAPDVLDVIATIREAGGVPVYAHPRASRRQKLVPIDIIEQMVRAGLFGLEAYHRDHSDDEVAEVLAIARQFGIPVTGSSDYHGKGKPNRLGENLTDPAVVEAIETQGALNIIWPR